MLANIAVLRTVKANVNEAIMVALPSILFESSHDKKNTQKYYLQGPAAEYIPVEIPDTYAKKFSKCATALAMQLVLLSNKTKGFFGPEICNVEGKISRLPGASQTPSWARDRQSFIARNLTMGCMTRNMRSANMRLRIGQTTLCHPLSLTAASGLS